MEAWPGVVALDIRKSRVVGHGCEDFSSHPIWRLIFLFNPIQMSVKKPLVDPIRLFLTDDFYLSFDVRFFWSAKAFLEIMMWHFFQSSSQICLRRARGLGMNPTKENDASVKSLSDCNISDSCATTYNHERTLSYAQGKFRYLSRGTQESFFMIACTSTDMIEPLEAVVLAQKRNPRPALSLLVWHVLLQVRGILASSYGVACKIWSSDNRLLENRLTLERRIMV